MMLVGIGCCCGLLLTAFGVRDSMTPIANLQYGDVQLYSIEATFDGEGVAKEQLATVEGIEFMTAQKGLVDIKAEKSMSSVNLVAYDSFAELKDYWHLYNSDGDLTPQGGKILINNKIADTLGLTVGDKLQITNAQMEESEFIIGGIFENYIFNYIFMSSEMYESAFGEYEKNTAFIITDKSGEELGGELTKLSSITSVSDLTKTQDQVNDALDCLNYIIWLVVAFCAALAFIVTFNLTNINLAERSREIATVEVLGFYPRETNSYVLRENIILSVIAAIVGIPIGYLFHYVVMEMVVVDTFAFQIHIEPLSYLYAFALTLVFAFLVNLFMRRQITKIPMVESLKAVE